jgi:hypothetical protein
MFENNTFIVYLKSNIDQSVLPTRLNMKVKTGRVDMLFVSNETMEEDVFLCEDKKESASLAEIMSVEKKNLQQRLLSIESWTKRFDPQYINDLEVITGLWHGCVFKVIATKIVLGITCHYELVKIAVPKKY